MMTNPLRFFSFILSFTAVLQVSALSDTLYIQTNTFSLATAVLAKTTLRKDTLAAPQNANLEVSLNETLVLTLVNQDTIEHYFSWHDQSANIWVNPGQAVTLSRTFNSFGSYALLATDFMGQRLGASCTVLVGQANYKRFVWNLWENNANESLQIAAQNQTTIPSQYRPDVFTINGLDYPLNMNDTLGMVQGLVHDSIYITVLNAGNMLHPIHFHGYHVQVVQSYLAPNKVNWKKDSFPVQQKDVVVFLLIPDKPGQYPVHDHNLTANTSAGGYPGGMMTMIEISQ